MKTVTIRELHARTGELVRQAQRHGEIWVTDHGRTIAKIIPEKGESEVSYFARRKLSPAFRKLDAAGKTAGGTDSTQVLSEDRADRI